MDIVLAFESVGVQFFIVDTFHLNCGVEKVVFSTQEICDLCKSFQRLD